MRGGNIGLVAIGIGNGGVGTQERWVWASW